MSLQIRLIGLIALILLLSLVLGGTVACVSASHSVQTEMRSALAVGSQTIAAAVGSLEPSDHVPRDLEQIVLSFKGNRHLRVSMTTNTATRAEPAIEQPVLDSVPPWLVRLIGGPPQTEQIAVSVGGRGYGSILLETDPHNEIVETWNEFGEDLLVLGVFFVATIALVYVVIGRGLRPLDRLAAGLEDIGRGNYRARISTPLPPELSKLRDSFNAMAQRLSEMDAENRRLSQRLLTLRDQERAELARDLHDEVGPFLFAIHIDAANISRHVDEGQPQRIPDHLHSIADAVTRMQRRVRQMLSRLRSVEVEEAGLAEAVGHLTQFWRRRHPGIDFQVALDTGCESFGEALDRTMYHIVQDCLSNAVRHGRPRTVRASIRQQRADAVLIEVTDDGQGMPEPRNLGFGLVGMRERVEALGGRLVITSAPGQGVSVSVTLPREPATAATHAEAAE
ncbi:MAG: HAMP domain-containing protein [Alphaproteobacteria bacterium]|nr:HAMP domain-containing protein [Alphaproteobacteria bacterium]